MRLAKGARLAWVSLAAICLGWLGLAGCMQSDVRSYIRDLSSPNLLVRQEAVSALAEAGDSAAVPHLIGLLEDRVPEIRLATARTLGSLRDTRATEAIVRRLRSEDRTQIRRALIEALGKLGDPRAVPNLLGLLDAAPTPTERYTTIWALGSIGDGRAADKLCQLLASPDKYVVYNATQALKQLR